ncbi:MAG: hypothetical protein H7Z19_08680, partial [Chitinophagaceae bacterium]|nr:hypothetical protein [Rubrivivax sp.]
MTHSPALSRFAAIAAAGLLAACGGGSDSAPTAPSGSTPPPTAPTPAPVATADFTLTLSADKAL